jgi:hypothetical protein
LLVDKAKAVDLAEQERQAILNTTSAKNGT